MKNLVHAIIPAILVAMTLNPIIALAENGNFDTRVHVALVQEGVRFKYDPDGDYFFAQFGTGEGRNQGVFVNSATKKEGEYEFREVWSMAYIGSPLSESRLEELLTDNFGVNIGGWQLGHGEQWIVVYSIRIAADAEGPTIKSAMLLCALMADKKEKEWSRDNKL